MDTRVKPGYDDEMDDIYSKRLLELAADVPHCGRLPAPDGSASLQAKLCGSTITVDIKLRGDVVTEFAQEVEACALGTAAASFFAAHVIGKNVNELSQLRQTMHAMLESNGPPPTGGWAELSLFENVRDYPIRHASTLLVFDATVAAIDHALARREADKLSSEMPLPG